MTSCGHKRTMGNNGGYATVTAVIGRSNLVPDYQATPPWATSSKPLHPGTQTAPFMATNGLNQP